MSTITVSGRGVATAREALEEVDAVVETLKDRADKVLEMLGHEAGERGDDGPGPAAAVAKEVGAALAVGTATKAARKVGKRAAKKAKKAAKKAGKRAAARAPVHAASEVLGGGRKKRKKWGDRGKSSRMPRPVVMIALAAVAVGAAAWLRSRRRRLAELEAVDETAPDAFGVVVERVELAGTLPPQ